MVASGVAEMMSRISRDEDDDEARVALLRQKTAAGDEVFRPMARQRRRALVRRCGQRMERGE
jgi:hypothetical protein